MNSPMKIVSLLFLALVLYGCSSSRSAAGGQSAGGEAATGGNPGLGMAESAIVARLDSMAAISRSDYIHLYIGPCKGWCEAYVSIFRESPAKFHIYEAEAWRYNEFDRSDILYRLRRPLTSDVAENMMLRASELGITRLVDDQTTAVTDHPRIWLRARIGGEIVVLNGTHLGGKLYAGAGRDSGLYKTYQELRTLLLAELYGTQTGAGER